MFTRQTYGTANVATIKPDWTGLTQRTFKTPGRTFRFDPCHSPDGTKIRFAHYLSTGGTDLFTMNPDGSSITQATRTVAPELDPEWAVAA